MTTTATNQVAARRHGNMLAMIALSGLVIVVILLVGFVVCMLVLSQQRIQSQAEHLSLSMAKRLNQDDLVGQTNNLVECSRELVYTSRQVSDDIYANHSRLRPLAVQLMDEARDGARLMESERLKVGEYCYSQLHDAVKEGVEGSNSAFVLPWLHTSLPTINGLQVGYIDGIESNVYGPEVEGLPELRQADINSKLLDETTNLYMGNINASLGDPDNDLDFKICSLPAPVEHTIAPARLTGTEKFKRFVTLIDDATWIKAKMEQLPSALRLELARDVKSNTDKNVKPTLQGQTSSTSVAAAGGGMPLP